MRLFIFIILIAFLSSDKEAICQKVSFNLILTETIYLDSVYGPEDLSYNNRIQCRWNSEANDQIALVYFNNDKTFTVKLFRKELNGFEKTLDQRLPGLADSSNVCHINRLFFSSNQLWIHYNGRFVTTIQFSARANEIIQVTHMDVRQKMDHSFRYIFPDGNTNAGYLGMMPSNQAICPVNPRDLFRDYCVYRFGEVSTSSKKIRCIENFDEEFWSYHLFSPIYSNGKYIYTLSPLTHDFYVFPNHSSKLKKRSVAGIEHFANNLDSMEKIRRISYSPTALKNVYPLHFYSRICGATDRYVYTFREFWPEAKKATYFLDRFGLVNGQWKITSSINLQEATFTGGDKEEHLWAQQSIYLSQLEVNDEHMARVVVEPETFDFQKIHENKIALFQVFTQK